MTARSAHAPRAAPNGTLEDDVLLSKSKAAPGSASTAVDPAATAKMRGSRPGSGGDRGRRRGSGDRRPTEASTSAASGLASVRAAGTLGPLPNELNEFESGVIAKTRRRGGGGQQASRPSSRGGESSPLGSSKRSAGGGGGRDHGVAMAAGAAAGAAGAAVARNAYGAPIQQQSTPPRPAAVSPYHGNGGGVPMEEYPMIQNAVMGSVDMPVDESGGIQAFVADTVVDATGVAVVMSEEEQEKEEERNYIRKGLLAALVITVIIVAVAVPLTIKFSDPGTKTILLTEAPTFFTPAPTMLPTNMPSPNDYPGMVDTLWSISGPALIESGTPQNQALDWIARDDGANRSPFDSRFVQRYVLAVFYFSTGGDQWLDCVEGEQCNRGNYWLSGDDECTWGGIVCGETPAGVFTINMGE